MSSTIRTLAIITARGGSKGIPRKNLVMLGGKPLIAYTIEAAKQSKYLTRCIVSTDDAEIAEVARKYGADVPFMRPSELSHDSTLALDVLQHAVHFLEENEGQTYDYTMMLHPTSPLRTGEDIDACIQLAADTGADSVMSMKTLPDFAPEKLKRIDGNGRILPFLVEEKGQSAPRQKGPTVYKRNCAVYLTKTPLILKGDQFGGYSVAYVMPEERSVDINDAADLDLAAFFLTRNQ